MRVTRSAKRLQKQQAKAMSGVNSFSRNGNIVDQNHRNQRQESPIVSAEPLHEGRLPGRNDNFIQEAEHNNFDGQIQSRDGVMMQQNVPSMYMRSPQMRGMSTSSLYTPYDNPMAEFYLRNQPIMGNPLFAEQYIRPNNYLKPYDALDLSCKSHFDNGLFRRKALDHATIAYSIYGELKQLSFAPSLAPSIAVYCNYIN